MKILLFGADGQVGWELRRALSPLGPVVALTRREADLAQPVQPLIERHGPDVIVNAAAYTAVDRAESEPELALRINGGAVGEMARSAAALGALLVHYSTDGSTAGAYNETDPTGPLSSYGRSKLAGEEAIHAVSGCEHLILRTSWVYAARGGNFARTILQRARTQERLQVVADTHGVPTHAELVADVTALVLQSVHRNAQRDPADLGTYHLVPGGATTWHGYACELIGLARAAGMALRVAPDAIAPVPASTFAAAAQRPLNSRLDNRRLERRFGLSLPDWRWHLARFVDSVAREA
jgi:dTDP-4-dehydrorhamnose reductase